MDGILPIWKPVDISSFDVIREIKHKLLHKLPDKVKIGHAGTLDPFADGVLLIMLGRATKKFDEIMAWGKTYRAIARLGAYSDTLDRTGTIIETGNVATIAPKPNELTGTITQAIPKYSAAKFNGKPRYTYARKGVGIPSKSKKVTIYSLDIIRFDHDEAELLISCSSGTYIRQLSYDLFHSVGTDSYLTQLTREAVGTITQKDCLTLDQVESVDRVQQHLLPVPDGSASLIALL